MKKLLGILLINIGITLLIVLDFNPRLTDKQLYDIALKGEANIMCKTGTGTGFFIDKETVITNSHVVALCLDTEVILNTVFGQVKAKVIKHDKDIDLAILKVIDMPKLFKPVPLKIAEKNAEITDRVFNASNKGNVAYSFHIGHVQNRLEYNSNTLIVTNTMMSFGSSGSAIINDNGEVVGVTTMIAPKYYMTLHVDLPILKKFIAGK
jgi:S1-C subfamily serine protease